MDVAGNVHRVLEFEQGDVCPILGGIEHRVCDDLAHRQQVVMVIEVLLSKLYSDVVGISNSPREKRYLFGNPEMVCEDPTPPHSPTRSLSHPAKARETYGPTQCAAVSTHCGWMREPPQKCIQ